MSWKLFNRSKNFVAISFGDYTPPEPPPVPPPPPPVEYKGVTIGDTATGFINGNLVRIVNSKLSEISTSDLFTLHTQQADPHPQYVTTAELYNTPGVFTSDMTFHTKALFPSKVATVNGTLAIYSRVSSSYVEPVWYIGLVGAESKALAFRSNGQMQMPSRGIFFDQGLTVADSAGNSAFGMQRGNSSVISLGEFNGLGVFSDRWLGSTPCDRIVSMNDSSSVNRRVYREIFTWLNSTGATRRAERQATISDTQDRPTTREYTDGTRGYFAHTIHNVEPANADMKDGELILWFSSNTLFFKYRQSAGLFRVGSIPFEVPVAP